MENKGFIRSLIDRISSAPDNASAFSLFDGTELHSVTYRQFADDVLKAANYFVSNGITGRHVAIAAPNSYRWVVSYLAALASGNTGILLNQNLDEQTIRQYCAKADLDLICADPASLANFRTYLSDYPLLSVDELTAQEPLPVHLVHESEPSQTVTMLFTSGTTGKSKVVEITSENLQYSIENFETQYTTEDLDRVMTPIPFHHILGFLHTIESLFYLKTICIGRDIRYLFADMAALNPAMLNTVPSIIESMTKLIRRASSESARQRFIGNRLRLISFGGAVLKKAVSSYLLDLGMTLTVYYGMTEISSTGTWCVIDRDHLDTAGKFCKHVKPGFDGNELLMSGPTLMKGYYRDPEETQKIIENGWIHTGDLGRIDEDGYLYLTGRKKNVIILSNGENVNPEEVEEKLGVCDSILECMVYSDGTGICADIYTENQDSAAAFVREYNARTPMYRQVYKVNYQDQPLQKTASGKIKRKENVYA